MQYEQEKNMKINYRVATRRLFSLEGKHDPILHVPNLRTRRHSGHRQPRVSNHKTRTRREVCQPLD